MADKSWLKVQPDKQYLISENRLRFPVQANVEPGMVPFVIAHDLRKAIDIYEKHRDWKLITAAPPKAKRKFPKGKPCCADFHGLKAGERVMFRFMPATFQGDTDDAHNFNELSDPTKRLEVEDIIDWVVVSHWWVPAMQFDNDAEAEYSKMLGLAEGFATRDSMPQGVLDYLKERRSNGR